MNNNETLILLFDGVCNLCNRAVQFIIRRDKKAKFKFATLQSERGKSILKNHGLSGNKSDTLVFIKGELYFLKSTAVLQILKETGNGWQLLYIFIIIPRFLRDFVYDCIAGTRYKIFGKKNNCMIPTPDIENRFLN